MNILLVSISAPPKNSPESVQTGRYVQYLTKNNNVTLLTTEITGGWEPADDSLLKYIKGVHRIVSVSTVHPKIISLIKRLALWPLIPDDACWFPLKFNKVLQSFSQKPDIIFSRSAPFSSALMAYKFHKKWNLPWIMHLSDPWADNPFHTFKPRAANRNQQLERECIESATLVTLTSEKAIEFYRVKYPALKDKFRFLPNVFDDESNSISVPIKFSDKATFVFTGRLYGNRNLYNLMNAIEAAVTKDPDFEKQTEFVFAGFFDQENIDRIRQSNLKNVKFLGPVSMQQALSLQREATVLIAIDSLSQDKMFELFFPSKLLDYFAARKPIIAITGNQSTTHQLVEGKHGKCFDEDSIKELPEFFLAIVYKYMRGEHFIKLSHSSSQYSAKENATALEKMLHEAIHMYAK